ncbi:MAG: DUF418 domain-containing protein [Pseudohongiellaceae bacterium]
MTDLTGSTGVTGLKQRISSLDFVRGVAILGILFMNIHIMALPMASYGNPDFDGMASLMDKLVFSFEYLFINTKFVGLFSLMFGVGMLIQGESLDRKGHNSGRWIRRRLIFLALFGAVHAAFIWPGDVLLTYAICGLILQSQRYHDARKLLRRGSIMIAIGLFVMSGFWIATGFAPEDVIQDLMAEFRPSAEALADDANVWTQRNYLQQLGPQVELWLNFIAILPFFSFWWCGGLMLIGMGLFKNGWFSRTRIHGGAWVAGALGLLLATLGLLYYWMTDFGNPRASISPLAPGSGMLLAVFYLNLFVVLAGKLDSLSHWLQQVGRMAFSLYLLQSVAMILMFRWVAPQLYGKAGELELFILVIGFILVQVFIANQWLEHYRQGPMEKLWRWLAFRNLPPAQAATAPVAPEQMQTDSNHNSTGDNDETNQSS